MGDSMKVLTKEECHEVLRLRYNAVPNWSIASSMNIPTEVITRIGSCARHHFPLEDYMIFDRPGYHLKPLGEKLEAWDLRLSLKLQRLPMSEWATAL